MVLDNCQSPLVHYIHVCLEAFGNIVNALIPVGINMGPNENFPIPDHKNFSFSRNPHPDSLPLGEDFSHHQSDTHWMHVFGL
jgi:hypothetical protein